MGLATMILGLALFIGAHVFVTLRAWRASDGESYVAFRPAREREMVRAAGAPVEILLRSPTLVLARVRAP